MAKQTINLGTAPTGAGGDTPRTAFQKAIDNFTELYAAFGSTGDPAVLPAALPVAKGGTGVATMAALLAALNTLGNYAKTNIIGTVSQASGVPTGAIIETGTNANGTYIKFADGTLECYAVSSTLATTSLAVGQLYAGFPPDMVFPYPFISPPVVIPLIRRSGSTTGQAWAYLPNSAPSAAQTSISMLSATTGATGYGAYVAKGRWF